ncbi:MAG TPA: [protein-PII] uridylyltransferase [Acidimicrobiales bacterium]|nr:[protein-PII] uridylyltransferase [Acidimicrobiales bacterium]
MVDVSLRDRRQALLDRHDLLGSSFGAAYAHEADQWLSHVADRASEGNHRHLALLAVGGYGRGELCPFSDLDVVLVHDGHRDIARIAEAIWYPVWDQGVHLDHSVRRPREVLNAASGDLRVALGLLDARLVWGDPKVSEPLIEDAVTRWRTDGGRWLSSLSEQMADRHRLQGDVAFLLEPDLKEGHGGLRDVNVLRAVAVYAPLLADYVDLPALAPATDVLNRARVELHRSAGRALDRLLLQEQDHVADVLSYPDADALMAAVAQAGRRIARVSEEAWRRRRFWEPESPRRLTGRLRARGEPVRPPRPGRGAPGGDNGRGVRTGPPEALEVEPGITIVGGEAALAPTAQVADDSSLPLRLAAVAAEHDLPIARGAVHRLADKSPPPTDPWPSETRESLVRVLASGKPAIDALESLDEQDLLSRLLPEWSAVRSKPQRNAYHRFTVDRHLLEAATNAAALVDRVDRPDLLLIGTLLHDIGKGFPGDHTEVGTELVAGIGTRMGFPPDDVEALVTMVRHHLLLPDVATRRDLDDPATVENVARAVGDRRTLRLLAALTEADSLATGPSAWGSWKAGLVAELTDRTERRLTGEPAAASAGWVTDGHRSVMQGVRAGGDPAVVLDPPRVVVAAPDRRGLLAAVAGTLALHGLDVRSADVSSEDGVAVEVFTVEVARDTWPDSARLRADLESVLAGRIVLDDQLAAKSAAYAGSHRPTSARPVEPRVSFDNDASASSTVLEVRALDELGLLHRVTGALFDCDLDVVSARVSTLGSEVIDAFYVRDRSGSKITEPEPLRAVEQAVRNAVQ